MFVDRKIPSVVKIKSLLTTVGVDALCQDGSRLLAAACEHGNFELVSELIEFCMVVEEDSRSVYIRFTWIAFLVAASN